MWPSISFKEKKLYDFRFSLRLVGKDDEGDNPNVTIKEIVMVYAAFNEIEFNLKDVACAVEYDTDFGYHTILFSKVDHLEYINRGIDWIAVYSSNYKQGDNMGDGDYESISEEVLTGIYRNTWSDIKKCAFYDCGFYDLEDSKCTFEKVKKILNIITPE